MDYWTICNLLNEHVVLLRLIFDRCRELKISLNLIKCIFCVPHGNLLGHIVCREGVLIEPAKVVVIVNMPLLTSANKLGAMLGHIGYYRRFTRRYATITTPLETILKKGEVFQWTREFDKEFDILKENISIAPILIFSKLGKGISCARRCIRYCLGIHLSASRRWSHGSSYILF
jgi:hypothetical protein